MILHHPDGQHHRIEAGELKTALQLVGSLVVQKALHPAFSLEDQLSGISIAKSLSGHVFPNPDRNQSNENVVH